MMLIKAVALGATLAAMAAQAHAATVTAQSPQTLVAALQGAGYQAQLGTDGAGDPLISSAASGSKFKIFFHNCTANKDCSTIQFYAGYKAEKPVALDRINEFNLSKRFVRAMIDKEQDPILTMDLDLDKGGIPDALFIDNLEIWSAILPDFERAIGFRS